MVGNVLDRTRFGYRIAISGSQILRAVVSLALIGSLLTGAVCPLMFVVLISRKVYALAKTALLSHMTDDRQSCFMPTPTSLAPGPSWAGSQR